MPVMKVSIVESGSYPDGPFGLVEDRPGEWSVRIYTSITEGGQTKFLTDRYIPLPTPKFRGTERAVRQQFKVLAEDTRAGEKLLIVKKKPERPRRGKTSNSSRQASNEEHHAA